ncbi:MAG: alpha-1,2-fucosyltransferase [Bacteroidetes bacterium]|nr:alpha-1,2-fucosyltransferase [Bacteroidota bacterium]
MDAVITRLMGGLGNQMFQYATGYTVAEHLGVPLLLDRTFLDSRPQGMNWTARAFELDVFQLPLAFATAHQVARMRRELDHRWCRYVRCQLPWLFSPTCFVQKGTGFDPAIFLHKAPIYLEGYWQNEKYFAASARALRQSLFVPKDALPERNAALLDRIRSTQSASMHVRRGDYVTNAEAGGYHGVCAVEYYTSSAALLAEQYGADHFFVFSDDPQWVRDHIHLPWPVTYVDLNSGHSAHWDLYLMKHCRHNIIANSSFSWWGAWLNPSPGKAVIAPAQWFQGVAAPITDIIPSTWIAR